MPIWQWVELHCTAPSSSMSSWLSLLVNCSSSISYHKTAQALQSILSLLPLFMSTHQHAAPSRSRASESLGVSLALQVSITILKGTFAFKLFQYFDGFVAHENGHKLSCDAVLRLANSEINSDW